MDDFSFPAAVADPDSLLQLPFPHFAASPLWFLPSAARPNPPRRRRSFASAADAYDAHSDGEEEDGFLGKRPPSDDESTGRFYENETMDMLWEDFNEELARLSYHRRQAPEKSGDEEKLPGHETPRAGSKPRKGSRRSKGDHPRGSQALAMTTKSSSSSIRHGRPGLALMLKLLRRLFMVQNLRSSRKTRHFDGQDDSAA